MKRKTLLLVVSMLLIISLVFTACSPKASTTDNAQAEGQGLTDEKMVLNLSLDAEPPQMDPQKAVI